MSLKVRIIPTADDGPMIGIDREPSTVDLIDEMTQTMLNCEELPAVSTVALLLRL